MKNKTQDASNYIYITYNQNGYGYTKRQALCATDEQNFERLLEEVKSKPNLYQDYRVFRDRYQAVTDVNGHSGHNNVKSAESKYFINQPDSAEVLNRLIGGK